MKIGRFWRIQRKIKQLRATVQRRASVIIIVGLFLVTAILPSTAQTLAENSLASGLPNKKSMVSQGEVLYQAQRFSDAVKILQQQNVTYAANGDKLQQAMTLSNLSLAYQELGRLFEAQDAIAQSLKLLQNLNNSKQRASILAQTLDVQGRLQLARGQAETALATWQQAADIYTQIGYKAHITIIKMLETC